MKAEEFDFNLPKELIAQKPIEPRDSSRLMVVKKAEGEIFHYHFYDLDKILKSGDVLVLNNTKVIPARLFGEKENTGASMEVLLLKQMEKNRWEVLVRPAKRLKLGQRVIFGEGLLSAVLENILPDGNRVMSFEYQGLFENVLDELGQMPLPPYITAELEEKDRYQTVYAKKSGSAAAPTAGLHFTPELLNRLRKKGIEIVEILLHVGLGTFRPVKTEDIRDHQMHTEFFSIEEEAAAKINKAKEEGRRIIAVGTTVVRTLESAAQISMEKDNEEIITAGSGWTDIFIYPGFEFKVIDSIITNFHFPRSTLIMLVSALAGKDLILKAYETAIKERYRFYSFGDSMFIDCSRKD